MILYLLQCSILFKLIDQRLNTTLGKYKQMLWLLTSSPCVYDAKFRLSIFTCISHLFRKSIQNAISMYNWELVFLS